MPPEPSLSQASLKSGLTAILKKVYPLHQAVLAWFRSLYTEVYAKVPDEGREPWLQFLGMSRCKCSQEEMYPTLLRFRNWFRLQRNARCPDPSQSPQRPRGEKVSRPRPCRNEERDRWVAGQRKLKNPPSWEQIFDEGCRLSAKRGWDMPGSWKSLEEAHRKYLKRKARQKPEPE